MPASARRSLGPICRQLSNLSETPSPGWAGTSGDPSSSGPVGGTSSRPSRLLRLVWNGRRDLYILGVRCRQQLTTCAADRARSSRAACPPSGYTRGRSWKRQNSRRSADVDEKSLGRCFETCLQSVVGESTSLNINKHRDDELFSSSDILPTTYTGCFNKKVAP